MPRIRSTRFGFAGRKGREPYALYAASNLGSLLALLATFHAAAAPAPQNLKDYRRVVIADDASGVQRAAAAELAQ